MTAPFIILADDEVAFVAATSKRLSQRNIETVLDPQWGRMPEGA